MMMMMTMTTRWRGCGDHGYDHCRWRQRWRVPTRPHRRRCGRGESRRREKEVSWQEVKRVR